MRRGVTAVAEGAQHAGANQARFFFAADDFELEAGLAANAVDQSVAVASLTRGAGGDGAVHDHVVAIHYAAEMAEGASGFRDGVWAERVAGEGIVAEADGGAFAIENFVTIGRSGAGDEQPESVRSGVDRGDVDRSGQLV